MLCRLSYASDREAVKLPNIPSRSLRRKRIFPAPTGNPPRPAPRGPSRRPLTVRRSGARTRPRAGEGIPRYAANQIATGRCRNADLSGSGPRVRPGMSASQIELAHAVGDEDLGGQPWARRFEVKAPPMRSRPASRPSPVPRTAARKSSRRPASQFGHRGRPRGPGRAVEGTRSRPSRAHLTNAPLHERERQGAGDGSTGSSIWNRSTSRGGPRSRSQVEGEILLDPELNDGRPQVR